MSDIKKEIKIQKIITNPEDKVGKISKISTKNEKLSDKIIKLE